jgi:hypothetical protein
MSAPDDFSLANGIADFAGVKRFGHNLILPDGE